MVEPRATPDQAWGNATKPRVISLRQNNPYLTLKALSREVGVSYQRVAQILTEAGVQVASCRNSVYVVVACDFCGKLKQVNTKQFISRLNRTKQQTVTCSNTCKFNLYRAMRPRVKAIRKKVKRAVVCRICGRGRMGPSIKDQICWGCYAGNRRGRLSGMNTRGEYARPPKDYGCGGKFPYHSNCLNCPEKDCVQ